MSVVCKKKKKKKKEKLDSACSSVMTLLQGMGGLLIKPAYEHLTHG